MNKNIIIVLAGGFLVAILVALLMRATLSGGKDSAVDLNRVEILIAAKNLKTGHELKAGDLKWKNWPEDSVFTGAIIRTDSQQPTEAINGKLLRPLVEGQPVHMTMVVGENKGDFLSANIQKGMRAVGVLVNAEVLADRLMRPGDFVDVMVTYQVRVNSRDNPEAQSVVNRYATETVIENVRILAIDQTDTKAVDEAEAGDGEKKVKSAKKAVLTVEVMPEDAEKLMLADKMGDLGLALRSIGDNTVPQSDRTTTDVGMSSVMTNLSNMRETSSGVRIYNGIQMQEAQARNVKQETGVNFDVQETSQPTLTLDHATLEGLTNEE